MVDKIWYNMEELIGGSEERVLIETYWNVNLEKCIVNCKMGGVLIETYWNVNIRAFMPALIAAAGINRNILECK